MIMKNLLNDLKDDENLRLVFDVEYFGDGVQELVVGEMSEGNRVSKDFLNSVEWLFTTNEYYSWAIGCSIDSFYIMGENGEIKTVDNFFEVPFILSPDIVEYRNYWNSLKIIDAHLYYFDYCEKNGYLISLKYVGWKKLLEDKRVSFSQEVKVDVSELLSDLVSDEKLRRVFDYYEDKNEAYGHAKYSLEMGNGWKGFPEMFKEIEWCFLCGHSTYCAIGLIKSTVFFMDSEGGFDCAECGIYDLPFLLNYSPFENEGLYLRYSFVIDDYLYYFSYCEKRKILLLPENYAWKAKLLELKSKNS